MGIVSWIVFGVLAGAISKWLMPGKDPGGLLITMLLGIGGSMVGGWVATFFGLGRVDGFNLGSMGVAVLGSMILLFAYRRLK